MPTETRRLGRLQRKSEAVVGGDNTTTRSMSWSTSQAGALPPLRPGRSPVAPTPTPKRQSRIPPPPIPEAPPKTLADSHNAIKIAVRAADGTTMTSSQSLVLTPSPHQRTPTTYNNTRHPRQAMPFTGQYAIPSAPVSEDRFQQRVGVSSSAPQPMERTTSPAKPSPSRPLRPIASQRYDDLQPFNPPFFRLTQREFRNLRKKAHKSAKHKFSDSYIAQELRNLGRGWDGFVRARADAEKQGSLPLFQRRLQAEIDETARLGLEMGQDPRSTSNSGAMPLPPGAVSMEAAREAANKGGLLAHENERNKRLSRKRVSSGQPSDRVAETRPLGTEKVQRPSAKASESPKDASRDRSHGKLAKLSHEDTSSDPAKQTAHRSRPRGNDRIPPPSIPVDRTRPRRVEKMPDYRIPRMREAAREANPNRQPRAPSPTPRDIYDKIQPEFVQFLCEWHGCQAVLNNLRKLKKHVGVAHGLEARNTLRCRWGTCGQFEEGELATPVVFGTIWELDAHVESRHMVSVMWHKGDGRNGRGVVVHSATEYPQYLFCNGVQITPSVKYQKTETLAEWRARKEKLKELYAHLATDAEIDSDSEDPDEDIDIPSA